MKKRLSLLISVLIAVTCTNVAGAWHGDAWSGETGIAMGDTFGQKPVCTVAWNLAYIGTEPLKDLRTVAVRYPAALEGHAEAQQPLGDWATVSYASSGSSSLANAVAFKRLAGSTGVICPEGSSTLDRLRGTEVRIEWETDAGSRLEIVRIDAVLRGTLYQRVDREHGGPDKIEWR
ncbi:MAG TPA: hypothetical protein VEP48_08775 [Methylomirabilota bacterium]|nr:hypothetical protein [Methylomirabilota bacterium]